MIKKVFILSGQPKGRLWCKRDLDFDGDFSKLNHPTLNPEAITQYPAEPIIGDRPD